MNYKLIILSVIFFIGIVACHQSDKHQSFNNLKKMEGKWVSIEGVTFNEHWQIISDSLMTGIGFSISENDTVFKELMKIYTLGDSVYFAAKTEENEEYVAFSLCESRTGNWKFINENHDYPNIIYYKLTDDTLLNAYISNIRGNKKIEFKLKKLRE